MESRSQRLARLTAVAAAAAPCALAAAVTLSGTEAGDWDAAIARVLIVAGPLGVGLFALGRPPFARFGALLVGVGLAWFLATLSTSDDPLLYSVGRVSGWGAELALLYAVLAFPSGRLSGRVDRVLVGALALTAVLLYLPTALLVEQYPLPSWLTTCDGGCPDNAFMLVGAEPAFVEEVVRPLRELLTVAGVASVAVILVARIHAASHVMRRVLTPVLAMAIFRLLAFLGTLGTRRVAPESAVVEIGVWLLALSVPAIAAAFLVGLLRWRLFVGSAMHRLAARLHGHPRPEELRAALGEAFDDPALEIVYWLGDGAGRWADAEGLPIERPAPPRGRSVTEVRDGDRRVAAIIHDSALRDDRAFIDTATSFALMTLDNHQLSAHAASLVREVRESRARIQAAADAERRRIERDLHDGAQQRLVALRIKLELAAERAGDRDGAELLRRLGAEVEDALDEVRSLAHGIYPAALADRGLVEGCARRRCGPSCPRPCSPPGSDATRARSRARRTSSASRLSRTPPSTRRERPPP